MEEKKTVPVTPPVTAARRVFPVDGRDRALLVLAWGVGVLCAEVLLWGLSGLGMTLLVAAWYGVLFWYGGAAPLARRENRLLLYAVGLLALTFALFANPWLRLWNTLALVLLMGIQMGGWPGMEVYSVGTSAMLGERFLRVMGGLFGYLGASVQALGSIRGLSRKKMPYVLGALLVCVPLLMVVFPLLTSADALFAQVTRRAADWFDEHLALWALRLIFGLLVAPFLFGLLYSLRRPEPLKRPARPVEGLSMEAAGPVTVLAVLDVLYAFFLAVQCAALFGGADYLAQDPLLTSADALFAQVTRRAADWFDEHLALWALRLIFGLLVAPFLFGLLYSLRRPEPLKRPARPVEGLSMEAAGPVTVLAVLDVLYAFFLAVQCAALFGGADYLAQVGISYASYARSGFFQLVAVAAVNLACLLACLALCKGEGRGLRMVQVLGTLLVAASGVLLVSALWRMNLYVGAYGLSFKRALTYWGMAVLAVLLAAALWKVWHRHFRWFRVLLSVGVAGWLLLNYANVDALVARYNIGRGLDTGAVLSASDGRLGALPALEELLEAQPEETELRQAVETLRDSARWQAAHWQTWSVAAWRGQ